MEFGSSSLLDLSNSIYRGVHLITKPCLPHVQISKVPIAVDFVFVCCCFFLCHVADCSSITVLSDMPYSHKCLKDF